MATTPVHLQNNIECTGVTYLHCLLMLMLAGFTKCTPLAQLLAHWSIQLFLNFSLFHRYRLYTFMGKTKHSWMDRYVVCWIGIFPLYFLVLSIFPESFYNWRCSFKNFVLHWIRCVIKSVFSSNYTKYVTLYPCNVCI